VLNVCAGAAITMAMQNSKIAPVFLPVEVVRVKAGISRMSFFFMMSPLSVITPKPNNSLRSNIALSP
jgi:hypothetical protein